jgi:uncharacterized protein (TIGR02996 family)
MAWHPSAYAPSLVEFQQAPELPPEPLYAPEARRLLDAILLHPGADEPRWNYAGWLESQRDPAGEFLKLQLANQHPERQQELLNQHGEEWRQRLARWAAEDLVYRRGMVEELSLAGRCFIARGAELFVHLPLRSIRFVAVQHIWAEFLACPTLARLQRIDLSHNALGPHEARLLVQCPYLNPRQELKLTGNPFGVEGLAILAEKFPPESFP